MKREGIKAWLLRVLKKLWGYIKRRRDRINISVVVKVIYKEKSDADVEVDVEVDQISKDELIAAIAASAKLTKADAGRALDAAMESRIKLRSFKVMEPEL